MLSSLSSPICLSAAKQVPTVELSYDHAISLVAQWLASGDLEKARALVGLLERQYPDDRQVAFLAAQAALAERDYHSAIRRLRRILSADPSLVRVRLELARALFLGGERAAARRHFEIALGGDLPDAARKNIQRYLQEIQTQTSSFELTVLVGPNSNPNHATTADSITLFGVNYKLNPDAQAASAVGAEITGAGKRAFGADEHSFLSTYFELHEYPGYYADFAFLQITAGHNFLRGNSVWSVEAGPLGALYQGRELYTGATLTASHGSPLGPRAGVTEFVTARRLEYVSDFSYLSATQIWLGASVRYALGGRTILWATLTPGLNAAADSAYGYRAAELSVGGAADLGRGMSVEASAAFDEFRYQAPQPMFQVTRRDRLTRLNLSIIARDWALQGFAPKLMIGSARNDSNIPLYEYTRTSVGLGVTKRF